MKKLFVAVTIASLATILASIGAQTGGLAFDAAGIAILYAPCYHHSSDLKTAFLFTLKLDDAGNWKIIKTRQISKKKLEEHQ